MLIRIGMPVQVMVLCNQFVYLINTFFIGQLGSAPLLSGLGMANVAIGITTNGFVVGFNSALASFVP